ncbi:MAG: non-ribosomal peptide synthetase, partial [Ferruginibacter sp.]
VKQGVKREMLVPVCMDRGIEMITGILAILKTGAAYVPIDIEYPAERISFMLEDIGANISLTKKNTSSKLQNGMHINVIEIDTNWSVICTGSVNNPLIKVEANQLAYVIYTSGSTGRPKGVMIEHRGIVNLSLSQSKALHLLPKTRTLQFASYGFDASCYEIFNTFLSGGCLVIPGKDSLLSADAFEMLINKHNVEVAVLPTSFQHLVKDSLGTIKTIVSAGEPLNEATGKYIQSQGIRLINAYGPTENSVCTTFSDDPIKSNQVVVIGKPINNVNVHMLNNNKLVPIGVPGEICIAGPGLARGYLNQADLTSEKFVPNPFSNNGGTRLYKTGDLGCWLPDGNIEYLGRKDDQVKIRGYRIELGEIESVLLQSGLVNQVAVISRADSNSNQLVAYITGQSFNKQAVIEYLNTKLPAYMVPGIWYEIDSFPVTSNGKIDKKALAALKSHQLLNNEYVAPRNELEEKLVNIWKELLNIDKVGITDNFFELGGHSLLAMRLVSYIERNLLLSIPIRILFQFTSIMELSKYLEVQDIETGSEKSTTKFQLLDI